jgi:hypothetical protein
VFGGILQTGRCHEIADDLLDEGPRGWLIVVWRGNAVRAETFQPSAETFQVPRHSNLMLILNLVLSLSKHAMPDSAS